MELTKQLRGRAVEYVSTDGQELLIHCADGHELLIKWVDENGTSVRGRPIVARAGVNVRLRTSEIEKLAELGRAARG